MEKTKLADLVALEKENRELQAQIGQLNRDTLNKIREIGLTQQNKIMRDILADPRVQLLKR